MKKNKLFAIPLSLAILAMSVTASFGAGPGDFLTRDSSTGLTVNTAESASAMDATDTADADTSAASAIAQLRLVPDATSNNYAGSKAEPIFGVQTDKPQVALSFDAGSDRGNGAAIMDILEKYNIRSTFFLTANWINSYPEEAAAIISRGHEVGNHSVSHPSFPKLSTVQMNTQIQQTHQLVKDKFGIDMCLFRYPYGDYNNNTMDVLKSNGYYAIQWTVDSIDWRNEGREIMINRVLNHKKLGNGTIVLMHLAATYTPSALEEIIVGLQAKGYEIVPVSHLIYEKNYHMNSAGIQIPEV